MYQRQTRPGLAANPSGLASCSGFKSDHSPDCASRKVLMPDLGADAGASEHDNRLGVCHQVGQPRSESESTLHPCASSFSVLGLVEIERPGITIIPGHVCNDGCDQPASEISVFGSKMWAFPYVDSELNLIANLGVHSLWVDTTDELLVVAAHEV